MFIRENSYGRKKSLIPLIVIVSIILFRLPVYSTGGIVKNVLVNTIADRDQGNSRGPEMTVFRILPGPGNPRNSEGDFITLKDGRILFVYSRYTGTSGGDNASAYLAGRYSSDGGKTWDSRDIKVVEQEGKMNVMSVSLIRLKNGEIALFYLRKNSESDCIPVMRISNDETRSWSNPRPCITDRKGYFVVNNSRVIQLGNGRIVIPVAIHKPGWKDIPEFFSMASYYSDDNGRSWNPGREAENPDNVLTQEPGVVELKNGNLLMIIRTDSGFQYRSVSGDKRETWSPVERSNIISPLSPAAIARIPSTGDLLLVWNNNGLNQKRTPLCVAVSRDEGATWINTRILENDPAGSFCYPAIHFSGSNVLIGYWNRADKNNSSSDIATINLSRIYK
jgi:sialidase-1